MFSLSNFFPFFHTLLTRPVCRSLVPHDSRILSRIFTESFSQTHPLARHEPEQDPSMSVLDQLSWEPRRQGDRIFRQCVCTRGEFGSCRNFNFNLYWRDELGVCEKAGQIFHPRRDAWRRTITDSFTIPTRPPTEHHLPLQGRWYLYRLAWSYLLDSDIFPLWFSTTRSSAIG